MGAKTLAKSGDFYYNENQVVCCISVKPLIPPQEAARGPAAMAAAAGSSKTKKSVKGESRFGEIYRKRV
nr:hypothetical protein [uncultured Gemmiger sp.]